MSYKLTNLSYEQLKDILEIMNENNKFYCFSCKSFFNEILEIKHKNLCPNCYEQDDFCYKSELQNAVYMEKIHMNSRYGNFVDKYDERKEIKKVKKEKYSDKLILNLKRVLLIYICFFSALTIIGMPISIYIVYRNVDKFYLKNRGYEKRYQQKYGKKVKEYIPFSERLENVDYKRKNNSRLILWIFCIVFFGMLISFISIRIIIILEVI